jgi:cellulose synthase/poly-beta-1,6-N-acetylglucosamine synthase-like glycosyltransferase
MGKMKTTGRDRSTGRQQNGSGLTVIVPAYNEGACIQDTIKSIQAQTVPPAEIVVVDDFSSDCTGDVARSCGVTVLRPPANTGSKAGAQNFALKNVHTPYVMAIDADTTLAPNAIEKLLPALDDPNIAAACGFVVPRRVKTLWERGRYIEYVFAFTFYKQIQDYYGKPLISSGCFSVYRTDILKANNGWSTRTMAEDMDLTWSFYHAGHGVRFVPDAVCYPIEPHNYHFMSKQLRRWSHGFVQNVKLHWRQVIDIPVLRSMVAVALFDAAVASLAYMVLLPLLAIFVNPLFLLAYLIDVPAMAIPVLYKAIQRKEVALALTSMPGFLVLRLVNGVFLLKALWRELVVKKPLLVYEKGH